jgi:tRNA dimethylallyltransferase
LRKNLEGRETEDLFEKLAQIDSVRAGQMNSSDRRNPRRLIRAIEVATWKLEHSGVSRGSRSRIPDSILMVGLTAPKDILEARIGNRVDARVKTGIKNELRRLIDSGVDWGQQSMQALGYKQWRDYFEGEVPEEVVTDEWKREERKYARRQLTWFRKDKRINWFDIVDGKFGKEVENLVKKWYTAPDSKKS